MALGETLYTDYERYIHTLDIPLLTLCVSDGWGPLCRGLNLDLPDMAFPHMNTLSGHAQAVTAFINTA